jgi:putative salt-induced outer membrane protein YdiY
MVDGGRIARHSARSKNAIGARFAASLLLAVLAAAPAPAAPKVDVVVLQNGTRLVGEIRSMSRGKLELRTDDMGTLQIEWDNVVEVTAPEYFEVEDLEGSLYFGSLQPGRSQGALEVVADWGKDAVLIHRVARIQLVKSSFWDRFRGSIDAGAGYTSATELFQVELDAELRYRRPTYEFKATADAVVTQQPEADDTQRSAFTASYTRVLPGRHRIFGQGAIEQNQELGFDLRSSVVGGWGYMLARSRRNELTTGTGLGVNREKPVEGESTTNVEAVAGFDWANFAYDFPNTDIRVTAFAFLGLSQWGRFRLESNLSLRREIFTDFYVGLRGYESYDSEPATEGAQKNDWGLSLTLGYTF